MTESFKGKFILTRIKTCRPEDLQTEDIECFISMLSCCKSSEDRREKEILLWINCCRHLVKNCSDNIPQQNLVSLTEVLVDCLAEESKFIRFTAATTLSQTVNCISDEDYVSNILQNLLSQIKTSRIKVQEAAEENVSHLATTESVIAKERNITDLATTRSVIAKEGNRDHLATIENILDVLLTLISPKSQPNRHQHLVICLIGAEWKDLCQNCLFSILSTFLFKSSSCKLHCKAHIESKSSEDREMTVIACNFMSLWCKLMKRLSIDEGNREKEDMLLMLIDPISDLIQIIGKIEKVNNLVFKNILKLLNLTVSVMDTASKSDALLSSKVKIGYILVDWLSEKCFLNFLLDFKAGFGGEMTLTNGVAASWLENSSLRCAVKLCVKLVSVILKTNDLDSGHKYKDLFCLVTKVDEFIGQMYWPKFEWVSVLFLEQDDEWVEVLIILLDIYMKGKELCCSDDIMDLIQPHKQFLLFLKTTTFDESLILDLLVSPETNFLRYLTRYLKIVLSEWHLFVQTHTEVFKEDKTIHSGHDNKEHTLHGMSKMMLDLNMENVKTSKAGFEASFNDGKSLSTGLNMLMEYDDEDDDDDNDDCVKNCYDINKDAMTFIDEAEKDNTQTDFKENTALDKTMTTLIRIRYKLQKCINSDVIQYNPQFLINLIENVEDLYEN